MFNERVLITGGAGFIGSRLVRALADAGAEPLVFDNLHPQVHGPSPSPVLAAPLVRADIRDRTAIERVVQDFRPTVVVHLAAETGTGQSSDEPARYCEVNVVGTAHLMEALRRCSRPPRRVVLAATRAVYGEGAYRTADGRIVVPAPRRAQDMAAGCFDVVGEGGEPLEPVATPEWAPPAPGSVYGSTKLMQEYLLQQAGGHWEPVLLRLQNVYGPGQSLRNPYTGVLSIFCQQALAGKTLNVFEDGRIHRDFVFVDDVVRAFVAACEAPPAAGRIVNVGSGEATTILQMAGLILRGLGLPADRLAVSGQFRAGDIRHALADIALAREVLGWTPRVTPEQGVTALVRWAQERAVGGAADDR